MLIIKIEAFENGAHDNDNREGNHILDGYAVIPPEVGTMETLENFPFGEVTVEEVNGKPTVVEWKPLPMPEPVPDPEPTLDERVQTLEDSSVEMSEALDLLLSGVTE